ncbi:hypothetical protein OESDEN_05273 [Oesophagostomum dentatum]|uniref:MADF domain-containing protein n=1 Tax=Oesophagostomum dentatum TaxID=61180 RepID=A0A0B1TFA9_OESDE|nr:hypothetical protein OESDEN_05273 [Oesophagostomum dentatum]
MTHFARKAERELFANDSDRHSNIADRSSQDKVRWLRELIKYRYPSQTQGSEISAWSACVRAINSYHCKKRRATPPAPANSKAPERHFYPPRSRSIRESSHLHENASPSSTNNFHSSDADIYEISE